jgi:hypothetical protein
VNSKLLAEEAYLLSLRDGTKWVFKEHNGRTNPNYEVAAYKVSEALGLGVVPETKHDQFYETKGSMQRYVEPFQQTINLPQTDPKIVYLDFVLC